MAPEQLLGVRGLATRQVRHLMYSSERSNAGATHIPRCPGQPPGGSRVRSLQVAPLEVAALKRVATRMYASTCPRSPAEGRASACACQPREKPNCFSRLLGRVKPAKSRALLVCGWCSLWAMTSRAPAQGWTQITALTNATYGPPRLFSLAGSADGRKLAAAADFYEIPFQDPLGVVYSSLDSGVTWTATFPGLPFWFWLRVYAVAASADGTKLAAVCEGLVYQETYFIYTSTNSGATWAPTSAPDCGWNAIASSADGNILVVVAWNGPLCVSTNSGATWTATADPWFWTGAAVSADGSKMVATSVARTNAIYVSADYGASWAATPAPPWFWTAVASSSDGTKWVAAALAPYGGIATSDNSGASWTVTSAPVADWVCVASSADGRTLVAAVDGGLIYTSADGGVSWAPADAPSTNWQSVVASADGGKLFAGNASGEIWISQTIAPPRLSLVSSPSNLTLAWTVSSADFLLQQSTNLTSWENITDVPALNLTNMQNQVTIPRSNGRNFYRLKRR